MPACCRLPDAVLLGGSVQAEPITLDDSDDEAAAGQLRPADAVAEAALGDIRRSTRSTRYRGTAEKFDVRLPWPP